MKQKFLYGSMSTVALFMSALVIMYINSKAGIIKSHGGTHIGPDTLFVVYIVATFSAVLSLVSAIKLKSSNNKLLFPYSILVAVTGVIALLAWLILHLAKYIVSYNAM